jgi:ATP-dependent exoDNAse (exonuclease V) alpha subunit
MAIPVIDFGVVKRSEGRSSVGGAAYMAGMYLYDRSTKAIHNHSVKQDVLHSEILAPANSPYWAHDQFELWNKVEESESWKIAQVAREGYAALPRELSFEQNIELARKFLHETFVAKGMIVDFAFHDTEASDGKRNPHIHFQMTMREIDPETGEFAKKKNREWNDKSNVSLWRAEFERHVNAALKHADSEARIDMRSYEEQGVDTIAQVHMGKEATALERRGILTDKGDHNRHARILNFMRKQAKQTFKSMQELPEQAFEYLQKWFGIGRKKSSQESDILHQQNTPRNPEQGR